MKDKKTIYSSILKQGVIEEFKTMPQDHYKFKNVKEIFITKDNKILASIEYYDTFNELKELKWLVGEVD